MTFLPQTALHALRAVATLAQLDPGESLRGTELAERAGIPQAYVSKVMRRLVVARLVDGQKGHGGGFKLAKAPGKITLRDVLAAVDIEFESGRCVFDFRRCDANAPCPLHEQWSELQRILTDWADHARLGRARGA